MNSYEPFDHRRQTAAFVDYWKKSGDLLLKNQFADVWGLHEMLQHRLTSVRERIDRREEHNRYEWKLSEDARVLSMSIYAIEGAIDEWTHNPNFVVSGDEKKIRAYEYADIAAVILRSGQPVSGLMDLCECVAKVYGHSQAASVRKTWEREGFHTSIKSGATAQAHAQNFMMTKQRILDYYSKGTIPKKP